MATEFWRRHGPMVLFSFAVLVQGVILVYRQSAFETEARLRDAAAEARNDAQDRRLDHMDEIGTRRLQLIEDRQNTVLQTLERMGRRFEKIEQELNQRK